MNDLLDFSIDFSDPEVVSAVDQLSLWSAMFGQMLLERVPMRRGMAVLDIGYGTGFPILELAQRLGDSCMVYGIDPWDAARERAEQKARLWQVTNVELRKGDAAEMPFPDATFDLLVCNLGVNNFSNPLAVFKECARVAKPGALLVLTTNPEGHMAEFYQVYEETLRELGKEDKLEKLHDHIAHRLSGETLTNMLHQSGFLLAALLGEDASMRFLDGSALLRHHFIRQGFLDGWISVLEPASRAEKEEVFACLEKNLNAYAEERGELALTIPMLYIEAERI